ncbi:helix-turn-helix domain-containing protein [Aliikangiella sp. G2MR2-5]|uniref:helix-turn-helix domain-containing protein n=1 Tax=Aliikangiella sp. G2MR2-5 TaxID=2788943 RepID=UPI0018A9FF95|nr:helix-turn-helix domain-containing protein [Aliikangiella sp. G2MR2-5]
MWVKKFRLQKCWSQEQLAEMSGLSVRTIQRLEKGQPASMESLKALASVFELDVTQLQQEQTMTSDLSSNETSIDNSQNNQQQVAGQRQWISYEEEQAIKYVENVKGFYMHLIAFIVVMSGLVMLNLWVTPNRLWFFYVLGSWLVGLVMHAAFTFPVLKIFSPEWEKRQVEKRLGRKL